MHEAELVTPETREGQKVLSIPSTRIAEELGRSIVQNIVMLGFFAAATKIVPIETMRQAVEESVPRGTEELNLRAFDAGGDTWDRLCETKMTEAQREGREVRGHGWRMDSV